MPYAEIFNNYLNYYIILSNDFVLNFTQGWVKKLLNESKYGGKCFIYDLMVSVAWFDNSFYCIVNRVVTNTEIGRQANASKVAMYILYGIEKCHSNMESKIVSGVL